MHNGEADRIMSLSIVTPIKNGEYLPQFIASNKKRFRKYPLLVVDSGDGDALKSYAHYYIKRDMPFWEARKHAYNKVQTQFILNLDADVIIPDGYLKDAISLLESKVDVVSIFYEDVNHCQGALEFGISVWKTEILKRLYDFSFEKIFSKEIVKVGQNIYSTLNNGWCECTYMWRKLAQADGKLETLAYRAKHLHQYR